MHRTLLQFITWFVHRARERNGKGKCICCIAAGILQTHSFDTNFHWWWPHKYIKSSHNIKNKHNLKHSIDYMFREACFSFDIIFQASYEYPDGTIEHFQWIMHRKRKSMRLAIDAYTYLTHHTHLSPVARLPPIQIIAVIICVGWWLCEMWINVVTMHLIRNNGSKKWWKMSFFESIDFAVIMD